MSHLFRWGPGALMVLALSLAALALPETDRAGISKSSSRELEILLLSTASIHGEVEPCG